MTMMNCYGGQTEIVSGDDRGELLHRAAEQQCDFGRAATNDEGMLGMDG